jgi:hypothetical protein
MCLPVHYSSKKKNTLNGNVSFPFLAWKFFIESCNSNYVAFLDTKKERKKDFIFYYYLLHAPQSSFMISGKLNQMLYANIVWEIYYKLTRR